MRTVEDAFVVLRKVLPENHFAQRRYIADVRNRGNDDTLGLELAPKVRERRARIDKMLQHVVADDRVEVSVG